MPVMVSRGCPYDCEFCCVPGVYGRRQRYLPIEHIVEDIRRTGAKQVMFLDDNIGLDEDTPHVFEETLEFLLRNSVPSISPCILTPYPGTRLFERLMREGRILHTNWSYYDHTTVCYQPKNMDPQELAERYLDFRNRFFSYSSIIQRGYAQLRVAPLTYLGMNLALHKTTKLMEEHFRNYSKWLHEQKSVPTLDRMKAPAVRQTEATV